MIAQELEFSDAEDLGKIQTGTLPAEAPNAGAVAENWRLSARSIVNLATAWTSLVMQRVMRVCQLILVIIVIRNDTITR